MQLDQNWSKQKFAPQRLPLQLNVTHSQSDALYRNHKPQMVFRRGARRLTYLAVLAEPPPGDPLRPSLLLPRLLALITLLLLPLRRIAAAAAASTKPQNPKPSLEG